MIKNLCILAAAVALTLSAVSQVGINSSGTPPNPKAGLDVDYSDKGFLQPRLSSSQRDAIINPPAGLRIYNTTTNCENYFNGTAWYSLCGSCIPGPPAQPTVISGNSSPCAGLTGLTYSVSSEPGTFYTWTLPPGWTQTGGGTTNSIVVTAGSSSGSIVVVPGNVSCGNGPSQTLVINTMSSPATPAAGSHIASATQIVWNWNASNGALGYRYNTVNNFATSTDAGNATQYTQTGLVCNTPYNLYVWSYNSCGNSPVQTLSQSTPACGVVCGSGITLNHVTSDGVSPVLKTITYNTVTYNGKCWIDRNLGADNVPTSALDATDAAAGWYWQFNRKQGYAVGPVPAVWNTADDNVGNWSAANDPCTILLGGSWRIPTDSEWISANTPWSGYNQAFSSALKLHAGGNLLLTSNGSLNNRAYSGRYWSSVQFSTSYGRNLHLGSNSSGIEDSNNKAHGFSIRCLAN